MTVEGVAEEETVRLEWVGGKEQATGGDSEEVVGTFESGGSGMAAFGAAGAGEEAGDVAFDEVLVEVGEEVGEALVGVADVT